MHFEGLSSVVVDGGMEGDGKDFDEDGLEQEESEVDGQGSDALLDIALIIDGDKAPGKEHPLRTAGDQADQKIRQLSPHGKDVIEK